MYLRTITRRNKDGSAVRYCQLAHNTGDPERQQARAEVVYSFGREDELDRQALKRLVRSISRFLDPADALQVGVGGELSFLSSRPLGGADVLDALGRDCRSPSHRQGGQRPAHRGWSSACCSNWWPNPHRPRPRSGRHWSGRLLTSHFPGGRSRC